MVEDKGWEQREQDSREARDGEDSTERDLVKVYWSRTDMFTFLLTVWRQRILSSENMKISAASGCRRLWLGVSLILPPSMTITPPPPVLPS